MSTVRCIIPENPDISGIGVRIAIYIQNLLCFAPALWALWDGEVKQEELDSAETQTTTNLVLAFAILISSIVQALTLGLTSYHASIVLSMSWMNNTNAFIFFILYVHHKRADVEPTWAAWYAHVREKFEFIIPRRKATHPRVRSAQGRRGSTESGGVGEGKSARIVIKRFVILLGSLHLSLMATLGIWMWSNLVIFGTDAAIEANKCAVSSATVAILGQGVPMGAKVLQIVSLVLYAMFLIPGINLILPMALFLFIYFQCRFRFPADTDETTANGKRSALPALVGLLVLLSINIIFIVDIEATLGRNEHLQSQGDETKWGFGQILAILLLFFPLRDLAETLLDRNFKRRQVEIAAQLTSAINGKDVDGIQHAIELGADFQKALDAEAGQEVVQLLLLKAVVRCYPGLVDILMQRSTIEINSTDDSGCTLLMIACDRPGTWPGDLETIQALLHHPEININATDPGNGRTALSKACARGNQPVVKQLILDPSTDINVEDDDRDTPLIIASKAGYASTALTLLQHPHIDANKVNRSGGTALLVAVGRGHQHIVQQLCHHEPTDVNLEDHDGNTPLILATKAGYVSTVLTLLQHPHIDANKPTKRGGTALMWAAARGHQLFVQYLCNHEGTDVNLEDNDGNTALIHASESGHVSTALTLLQHPDIDTNVANKFAVTALMMAASKGHRAVVQEILEHPNTDVNLQDKDGATALIHASDVGDPSVTELLLGSSNIETNKATTFKQTALMFASMKGHVPVVQQLLNHADVDPNAEDSEGHTPLMAAAWHGHTSIVELLLNHRAANPNAQDCEGHTPLMSAALNGHASIVDLLLDHPNINPNLDNVAGKTALHFALDSGHNQIAEKLSGPRRARRPT